MSVFTKLTELALCLKKKKIAPFSCIHFAGVDASFSVDFGSTPLCQVPDVFMYIAEYLYSEGEKEQDEMPEARESTPLPEPGSDSSSHRASFTTTTPPWESTSTRSLMDGVPPNRCT